MKANIIAVIPARGGSKGIPGKNARLLCGKPLVAYAIEAALHSRYIDKVVVSTEDETLSEVSRIYGASVIPRPQELAADEVTLDPVICHAVDTVEKREAVKYDLVITIQPTSPLLSAGTIDKALGLMLDGNHDTLIGVAARTHLYWRRNGESAVPLYRERENRQNLEPIFEETGALMVCRRGVMKRKTRIGDSVCLFEIPERESVDIDGYTDWWTAEGLLKRLRIVLRTDGDEKMGLGHIYRALTLASRIFNHQVVFLTDGSKELGARKLKEHNYPVLTFRNKTGPFEMLKKLKADIIVNDILDTDRKYISRLKNQGLFVVNFEDMGEGAELADIVINALYENGPPADNHYYGYRYLCLRDEFHIFPPPEVRDKVKNILITFGGVDENNLTIRTLRAIEGLKLRSSRVVVIIGIGYPYKERLRSYVAALKGEGFNIELKENVSIMAKYMAAADVVATSNGRTLYEAANLGIPCLSISQNERETRHLFAQVCSGIMNLGIAYGVSDDDIAGALKRLSDDPSLRQEMHEDMLKFDLRQGTERTLRLIFDSYREAKTQESDKPRQENGREANNHSNRQ
jgi:CMP-N-acetylneuraminic acid synthetase/spore coat polysaccharide biosynthesis predicted glycosyltransferase SpsG